MTDTPTRFAFDRATAEPILRKIEAAARLDGYLGDNRPTELPAERIDDAECIGLDGFTPGWTTENESGIAALIRVAWGLWLTGPGEPFYVNDRDGDCFTFEAHLGDYPATVRLNSGWEDGKHIVDRDEKGDHVENTDAALSILDNLVNRLNAALTELDNYVAARAADYAARRMADLVRVSNDDEHDTLNDLRVRAGHLWVCPNDGWRNLDDEQTCGDCGSGRAAVLGETKVA